MFNEGDTVKVGIGTCDVVEIRGPLGPKGEMVYRVAYGPEQYIDVLESQLGPKGEMVYRVAYGPEQYIDVLESQLEKAPPRNIDLIVCYTTGWEECWEHKTIPLRYPSVEQFLLDFEKRLIEVRKAQDVDAEARKNWMTEQPNPSRVRGRKKIAEAKANYDKDMVAWQAKRPYPTAPALKIAGHEFYFWDFYKLNQKRDGYSDEYSLPEVYELMEWFEANVTEE